MYGLAIAIANLLIICPYLRLPRNPYPLGHIWVVVGVTLVTTVISAAIVLVFDMKRISTKATCYSTILKILDISCISCIVSMFSYFLCLSAVGSCNINWIEYSVTCVIFFMIVVAHYFIWKKVYEDGDAPHYKDKSKNILLSYIVVLGPLMFELVALIHHRPPWIWYLVVSVFTAILFACNIFDDTRLIKRKYACRNLEATHQEDNGNINHC